MKPKNVEVLDLHDRDRNHMGRSEHEDAIYPLDHRHPMNIQFDVIEDKEHNIAFITSAEGEVVLYNPLLNKGTAFNKSERERFGLSCLLPPHILTLEEQIEKIHERFDDFEKPLLLARFCRIVDVKKVIDLRRDIEIARYNFLRDLQERNEFLFYAYVYKYMDEVIPIIYTPTVGDGAELYSRISTRFRGTFLSPFNIDGVESAFNHIRFKSPSIAVVTDNQGILGLGDQGVGGIAISIGKLALYVLGAGIRPWETLPITLDVGTDNSHDLNDSYYLGYKRERLKGAEYEAFIDKFIDGIKAKFPNILIQWEDFSKQNAFTILDKYRNKVLSFNDDIQGTGAVALAGLLNALRCSGESLKDQRFAIYGAGAGGIGIARQIVSCLELKYGLTKEAALDRIVAIDSKGMITNQREVEDYKKSFSKGSNLYENWDVEDISHISLLEVVKNFRPTVLIGTSGCPGHFTKEVICAMAKNTARPIIFPLSNPTSKAEATPREIYKNTKGRAIVATGSPFKSFQYNGETIVIGQGNNFFIFPGVGFGAVISHGDYISDAVFTEAAYTLSKLTTEELIKKGTVYPPITDIRNISAHIALTTTLQIAKEQNTLEYTLEEIKSMMWKPGYHPLIKY